MPLHLDIITPEATVFSGEVVMAVLPGSEGQLGILANHAPLVTALRAGSVNLYAPDMQTLSQSIAITGGFAEVKDNRLVVLTEGIAA